MRLRIAVSVLACAVTLESNAQNCTSQYYAANSGSLITFSAGSGILESQIESAIEEWTACAGAGFAFPEMSLSGTGAFNIDVVLEPGISTTSSGGCGVFEHELGSNGEVIGGTIVLFDADILGRDCESFRSTTIAHEIGHVLGLGNSDCPGYIMSASPQRSVQPDECEAADELWETSEEEAPPPPPEDPEAPPLCDTSPILIDVDRNGFHLGGLADAVTFDIDADGFLDRITWTSAGEGDAFLALDRNGNSRIDDGSELFGTATRLRDGSLAPNGYEALAEWDRPANGGDGDGFITADDAIWPALLLWTDADHDAHSGAGEIVSAAPGLVAIELDYRESRRRDASGNELRYASRARLRGVSESTRTVQTVDVFFVLAD